ncbi:hypothetical protein AgCh_025462 [Apium graveolens]
MSSHYYIRSRAILTPTNVVVDDINNNILEKILGTLHTYLSQDSIDNVGDEDNEFRSAFPVEYLNSLNMPCIPKHELNIKSHGQSLDTVGLYLPRAVFSHGHVYVAISRVTRPEGLYILIDSDDDMQGHHHLSNLDGNHTAWTLKDSVITSRSTVGSPRLIADGGKTRGTHMHIFGITPPFHHRRLSGEPAVTGGRERKESDGNYQEEGLQRQNITKGDEAES